MPLFKITMKKNSRYSTQTLETLTFQDLFQYLKNKTSYDELLIYECVIINNHKKKQVPQSEFHTSLKVSHSPSGGKRETFVIPNFNRNKFGNVSNMLDELLPNSHNITFNIF